MGKTDDIQIGRNDGMRYALQIIDLAGGGEKGIEELRKEVKRRGITGVGIRANHKEIDEACYAIKAQVVDCVLAMSMHVLKDEFGFGHERLGRFKARYNKKTECMLPDEKGRVYLIWADVLDAIKNESKFDLEIRYND